VKFHKEFFIIMFVRVL